MVPSSGAGKISGVFSSTLETLSSSVFILFTALFLAASPGLYRHMFKTLFPPRLRERVDGTVSRSICTLKYWLLGQAVSMSVVGLITGIALAIAGVPFAAALGIVAGIAEFIPLVGPLLASIPALLLGLSEGTNKGPRTT